MYIVGMESDTRAYFTVDSSSSWNYLSSIGSGITLICWLYLQLARLVHERVNQQIAGSNR